MSLTKADIDFFISVAGYDRCLFDPDSLNSHSWDETGIYHMMPELIIFPVNKHEVSAIVVYCYEKKIAITPKGAGTSLTASAVPSKNGIILSLIKMNKIIELDEHNQTITVEPGIIVEEIRNESSNYGLTYPVDPASSGSCTIGGNIMTNAAGPHSYKYGVTRNYILTMELILANGEVLRTGSLTDKNSSGYNFGQLICGSEVTLAILTEVTLKLLPLNKILSSMLVFCPSIDSAFNIVTCLRKNNLGISAIEFMEKAAINLSLNQLDHLPFQIPEATNALLLLDLESNEAEQIEKSTIELVSLISEYQPLDILIADDFAQRNALWSIRRQIGHAVRQYSPYREVDTVVPVSVLKKLYTKVQEVGNSFGFNAIIYGHIGNGNLHINILRESNSDNKWHLICTEGVNSIFEFVVQFGGTLSAEHGIGLLNKPFLGLKFSPEEIRLMREIKSVFDPKSILNPGKIFD